MQLGINYPWRNYGWDFGEPVADWGERATFRRTLPAELSRLRRSGVTLLRWFLLGDGVTQGVGSAAPVRERSGFCVPQVAPLSPAFLEDFSWLLAQCEEANVQLIPVLMGASWAYPGLDRNSTDLTTLRIWSVSRKAAARLPQGYVKGGRRDVLVDPALRRDFLARVLGPLVEASARSRRALYAWELFNEPEWVTQLTWFDRLHPARTVPISAMLDFIGEAAALVHEQGFHSTVGFARPQSPLLFAKRAGRSLDLSVPQVHYYPRFGSRLLPARAYGDGPVLLGELATCIRRRRSLTQPFDVANPWPELTDQTLAARLEHARSQGYQAAIVWSLRARDGATDRDAERMLAALGRYAGAPDCEIDRA